MSKTDPILIAKIQSFATHADLLALLNTPAQQAAFGPSGKAFEYLIVRAFEMEGLPVEYPFEVLADDLTGSGSKKTYEQIDGVVYGSAPFLIESKDYASAVNIEPIAKLRFRLETRPSHAMAIVFAQASLTEAAEYFLRASKPRNVLTWYGDELKHALSLWTPVNTKPMTAALERKYHRCVELGVPDYNIL